MNDTRSPRSVQGATAHDLAAALGCTAVGGTTKLVLIGIANMGTADLDEPLHVAALLRYGSTKDLQVPIMRLLLHGLIVEVAPGAFRLRAADESVPAPECAYCGAPAEHKEHVFPRSRRREFLDRGVAIADVNRLVPACETCNLSKGARTPSEWIAAMLRGSSRKRKALVQVITNRSEVAGLITSDSLRMAIEAHREVGF